MALDSGYAGDVGPREAWDILAAHASAVLVDVRTDAEWAYVGLPDLDRLSKTVHCLSWQTYPDMATNPDFVADLKARGVGEEQPILLLCRSGARSRDAAIALTAAGFQRCYNVANGFEGPLDETRQRGVKTGWKASGLPWTQR